MALLKIKDFDPDYRDAFGGYDIKGLDVYSDLNNEKIGNVHDLMVDEQGHFRYFVIDLGFWGFGKKVMLPIDRARVDDDGKHLYALGLNKSHVEALPEFNESLKIDDDRRQELRDHLQQPIGEPPHPASNVPPANLPPQAPPAPQVAPLESSPPLEQPIRGQVPPANQVPGYVVPPPPPSYPQQPPQQPYPAAPASGQVSGYAPQPVTDPAARPYPTQPAQNGYPTAPSVPVLQRFEERLRAKRMQSH
jgi:stress response protein YsnF